MVQKPWGRRMFGLQAGQCDQRHMKEEMSSEKWQESGGGGRGTYRPLEEPGFYTRSQAAGGRLWQKITLALLGTGWRKTRAKARSQLGDTASNQVRNYTAWTRGSSREGEKCKEIGIILKVEMTEFHVGWDQKGKRLYWIQKCFKVIWNIYFNGTQISLTAYAETRILYMWHKMKSESSAEGQMFEKYEGERWKNQTSTSRKFCRGNESWG